MITYKTVSWKNIREITVRNNSGKLTLQELITKDGSKLDSPNEIKDQLSKEEGITNSIQVRLINLDDFLSPELNIEYNGFFEWDTSLDTEDEYLSKLIDGAHLTEAGVTHIVSPIEEFFNNHGSQSSYSKSSSLLHSFDLDPENNYDFKHYTLRVLIEMAIIDGHVDLMEKMLLTQAFGALKVDIIELDDIRTIPLDEALNYFKGGHAELKSSMLSSLKNMILADGSVAENEIKFLAYVKKEINLN